MIGTEDVDDAVGALQLLVVVGDVVREIRRPPVAADRRRGLRRRRRRSCAATSRRPSRTARPGSRRRSIPALDRAGVVQLAVRDCQRSNVDAEPCAPRLAARRRSRRGANRAKAATPSASGACSQRSPSRARSRSAIGDQIVARITVLGERERRLEQLPVARVDRAPERLELRAGVVDDPLGEDVVAGVAQRAAPACRRSRACALARRPADRSGSRCRIPARSARPSRRRGRTPSPSRSTSPTTRCQNAGCSVRLMKPATGVARGDRRAHAVVLSARAR